MNFQEFLAIKQAVALVEHMDTLSEQDARDLFNQLDQATIELIEAVLSENLPVVLQRSETTPEDQQRRTGVAHVVHQTSYSGSGKTDPIFGGKTSKRSRMGRNAQARLRGSTEHVERMRLDPSVKNKDMQRATTARDRAQQQVDRIYPTQQ